MYNRGRKRKKSSLDRIHSAPSDSSPNFDEGERIYGDILSHLKTKYWSGKKSRKKYKNC
jgi:hypothetical protein